MTNLYRMKNRTLSVQRYKPFTLVVSQAPCAARDEGLFEYGLNLGTANALLLDCSNLSTVLASPSLSGIVDSRGHDDFPYLDVLQPTPFKAFPFSLTSRVEMSWESPKNSEFSANKIKDRNENTK